MCDLRYILMILLIMLVGKVQAEEILLEGNFKYSPADKLPEGWMLPASAYWHPSASSGDVLTVVRSEQGSLLKIKNNNIKKGLMIESKKIKLNKQKNLLVKIEYALKDIKTGAKQWNAANVRLNFFDASGGRIKRYDRMDFKENTDMIKAEKEFSVPGKAESFNLLLGFDGAVGIFDVTYLSVQSTSSIQESAINFENHWNKEPVVKQSDTREEVVLNGYWKFRPLDITDESTEWGYILVPGLWYNGHSWLKPVTGNVVKYPDNESWNEKMLRKCSLALYKRPLTIPENWAGSRISIKFEHICTDAEVYLDDKSVGIVNWPEGEIDLTEIAQPGKSYELKVKVVAKEDKEFIEDFNNYDGKKIKATVFNRGISGNVTLLSRPKGINISDLFILTSVRNKTIKFIVSLDSIQGSKNIEFNFKIYDLAGKLAKEFSASKEVSGDTQPIEFTYDWQDPKLWDFLQPNLYNLKANVKLNEESDQVCQRFGFREIRIKERDILLNEKPFRTRLTMVNSPCIGGMRSVLKHVMPNIINSNFNLIQLSPHVDVYKRGTVNFRKEWAEVADELGLPILMPAVNFSPFIPWGSLGNESAFSDFKEALKKDWRKLQNHPSILFFYSGFNRFSDFDDQNPRKLGNGKRLFDYADESYKKLAGMGNKIMDIMRDVDPSRPALSHQSSSVGDMHLINMYLNLIPLQEREEWLSDWVKNGDKPFMAIEFGCPVSLNMMRGRDGGLHVSLLSEPLLTEFCAIYLGNEAYRSENNSYRKAVSQYWKSTGKYRTWHLAPEICNAPAYTKLIRLFLKNTWRSWRSWGMTGGLNPWESASGWDNLVKGSVKTQPFKPFTKEPYAPLISKRYYNCYGKEMRNKTGDLLVGLNAPTLSWIAGTESNFTEKDHNYFSGKSVHKQVVLINDERKKQKFDYSCRAEISGKLVFAVNKNGEMAPGENKFFPIEFKLPEVTKQEKCKITLISKIGDISSSDEFQIDVYPVPENKVETISLYDTTGNTRKYFETANIDVVSWDGGVTPKANVLIVGKDMLADDKLPMKKIADYVRQGGRVIFLENKPELLRDKLALRVARQVSRRAFPVETMKHHQVVSGFDSNSLRDWRGSGTNVKSTAHTQLNKLGTSRYPSYGWHWGNTGAVSSAMIEKPHCSSWTPLFEGEFAMAFSPLMEMKYGDGLVLLSTFDLIGRTIKDPAAVKLLKRMIDYAKSFKSKKENISTYYYGGKTDYDFLKKLQLKFTQIDSVPNKPCLLIVGRNQKINEDKIKEFIRNGGKVFMLPRTENKVLGFSIKTGTYEKNINMPEWEFCKGLSLSDFYLKVAFECKLLEGDNTALQGVLGKYQDGKGQAVIMQLHPDMLNSKHYDYYRYSSWRLTRAISQIIANLGGTFAADDNFFVLRIKKDGSKPVLLPQIWKAEFERKVSAYKENNADKRIVDTENIGEKNGWHKNDFDDRKWPFLKVGKYWEMQGEHWEGTNGVIWYRCKVNVPDEWKGKKLLLSLGKIDDMDTTYFNGDVIGRTNDKTSKTYYSDIRKYLIEQSLVRYGHENTVAVRVFDNYGNGGFYSDHTKITISPVENNYGEDIYDNYVSGFNTDMKLGDDPYRYWRW